jgi:hypothetical protein
MVAPARAHAWGRDGHQVVAIIAEHHLTPAARAQVLELLHADGATHLAEVASWADDYRNQHRETGPWHFVDIELGDQRYDQARDCPKGECVVAKLSEFAKVLADPAASQADRIMALKFVVHFAGDLHQPLHCADHHDKGGNTVQVLYRGNTVNLHHVWDTELVEAAGGNDPAKLAADLDAGLPPPVSDELAHRAPADWASEAHATAVKVAYGALPNNPAEDLAGAYTDAAVPVVKVHLEEAGFRLARVLNEALR